VTGPLATLLEGWRQQVRDTDPVRFEGTVVQMVGLVLESQGPPARLGEVCLVDAGQGPAIPTEAVGFREGRLLLMPLGPMDGVAPGARVRGTGRGLRVPVGPRLLGRIVDGLGQPIDGKGPLAAAQWAPVDRMPPNPLERQRILEPMATGVRALDAMLTVGYGQRLGIFAGSGVGKSTLLGMLARQAEADVNVIALIGERGREVREFLEEDLGEAGLARSVVVVATSDAPALVRLKGAFVATAIAEAFRDMGARVLLMMDSVTRFAMAQREVGLATGEPPATKGYTPSVFALLPRLLERAGMGAVGGITGLYTVLVDADDFNEPISDAVRGILDGHVILSRALAAQNHYPAIDILQSVSRVQPLIQPAEPLTHAAALRERMATWQENKDIISLGAYVPGSDAAIDRAIALRPDIDAFLRQDRHEAVAFGDTMARLAELAGR
jgi:FliI/YscN family ATPase